MTIRRSTVFRVFAFLACALLSGCQHQPATATLYGDLGGRTGVTRLVDAFIDRLAEDPLVVPVFADTDMSQFRRMAIDHLCSVADGGCRYEGRDMVEAHRGLDLQPRHFNAVVEDLMQAMDDLAVPQGTQNRLLGRLAPMYSDVLSRGVEPVASRQR
jgi:hemoglobin